MPNWRELAAGAIQQTARLPAPGAPLLPLGLAGSVAQLEGMPPPRNIAKLEQWQPIVTDALRLAHDGWAAKALALGWSPHDVFGVGPHNSDEFEGLAIWLSGRTLVALTEWQARTNCGALFYREEYQRPKSWRAQPVFLWQFGRS